ncbi:MAG: sigma-54-dependent Fis family transcriptional regulator [Candidatus Cloacimonetes bacterium]|nr:sigma-54-dependent Fis family transcriptional regulator [Candidatus Cloacimonadota bacterium]
MTNKSDVRILIVDDSIETLQMFKSQLGGDYTVYTANSLAEGRVLLEKTRFHIAIIDMILPGEHGVDLIQEIKQQYPYVAVIAISGQATIEDAVTAMKLGAAEFIVKPIRKLDLINILVEKILRNQWLIEENKRLSELVQRDLETDMIIGNSPAVQNILQRVKKVARLDTLVLISGETGVGKSVFAELIHVNSLRKLKKFVSVNCGSLTETLLESLLFGHKRGAFTDAWRDKIGYFQEANGGTLFLDEITETSLSFQVKLLKVLETGVFRQVGSDHDIQTDVRVIAASNKDIKEQVELGAFREDLYYRLNVISLNIPPLRERRDDIKLLTSAFIREFCTKYKKTELTVSPAVMSILLSYSWKGNVRELRNAIEHSVILAEHSIIQPEDLPESILPEHVGDTAPAVNINQPWQQAKEEFENCYLISLLEHTGGNFTDAARISGIPRENIYRKCNNLQIDYKHFRRDSER